MAAGHIRPLQEKDLSEAGALLADEGWTFTPRELGRVLATAPGLSVAAFDGADVQGLLTVARHGDLAWIGNVAVRPGLRGRGLGEALVRDSLERCRTGGVKTVKLCSVPPAIPLYQRCGFRPEGLTRTLATIHERPTHRPVETEVLLPDDLPDVAALDRDCFGADRSDLLRFLVRDYPDTGVLIRQRGRIAGFAFLRPGSEGSELGPLVTAERDPLVAGALLDACLNFRLAGPAAALETTTHALNPWMERLLQERGFRQRATSVLMYHGAPLAQDWLRCGSLGGLEKG